MLYEKLVDVTNKGRAQSGLKKDGVFTSYPDIVERIAPFCGTAKTTPHNVVFLQSVRSALTADAAWMEGNYEDQPVKGMRAFSHVYAGWAFSQPFYKRGLYR